MIATFHSPKSQIIKDKIHHPLFFQKQFDHRQVNYCASFPSSCQEVKFFWHHASAKNQACFVVFLAKVFIRFGAESDDGSSEHRRHQNKQGTANAVCYLS